MHVVSNHNAIVPSVSKFPMDKGLIFESIDYQESDSSHKNLQLFWLANSMALIAESSAKHAFSFPTFSANPSKKSAALSLKIPPQEAVREDEAPSVLHLIQWGMGGCQVTSMIWGALGGCKLILNFLMRANSLILEEAVAFVRLTESAMLEIIHATELLQGIFLSLNLAPNTLSIWTMKNKWKDDSVWDKHREHMEGRWHPLRDKLSSVGNLFSINLHTNSDLDGGKIGKWWDLNL